MIDMSALPARADSRAAGLLLTLPDLVAGLTALPKTTALTSYSYRLDHARQTALPTGLDKAMIQANLITDTGRDLGLDFHANMHWGPDAALEKHYVPTRSQRTRSVLSFFAQDGASQTLVNTNADLSQATQASEVQVFADHWKTLTGGYPRRLVMDQKVTNQNMLAQLHDRGITVITQRMGSPGLTRSPPCPPPRGAPSDRASAC